jgi:hypothetical protein
MHTLEAFLPPMATSTLFLLKPTEVKKYLLLGW